MIPALTIFLGAFLAFLVQPLVGNTLLPVFGGTAGVWTMCLAAFQTLLVGGYFYAHLASRNRIVRRSRSVVHVILAIAVGIALLFACGGAGRFHGAVPLLCAVAVAYVILSANSSLVQVVSGLKNPYRLYAVSNAGSLFGLLSYPFVFEYFMPLSLQWRVFAWAVVVYGALFAALAIGVRARQEIPLEANQPDPVAAKCSLLQYFGLSFASCYLLNAVSMHLCSDVTPLPMMWCVLLSLYLLSYIVAFTDRGSAWARWASVVAVPLCGFASYHLGCAAYSEYPLELATGAAVLLVGGWVIHARLYRLRPAGECLTRYYLMIALGGASGGAVCSFVMPHVTTFVAEYPIALSMVLAAVYLDAEEALGAFARRRGLAYRRELVRRVALGVLAVFAFYGFMRGKTVGGGVAIQRFRNFYGTGSIVRVAERDLFGRKTNERNEFRSQSTIHGFQMLSGEWKSPLPTCYYGEIAGGQAIVAHLKYKDGKALRVALCGMGIGTLASYSRRGDFYRFYEINPAVAAIAQDERYFAFLSRAQGKVEVVVDDARRALERERTADEEKYDVIVLDVFNGDSIPMHMATKEAFRLYLDRLAPGGLIAMHITNWHLDLKPVIKAVACAFGLKAKIFGNAEQGCTFGSIWAYLSKGEVPVSEERGVRQELPLDKVDDFPLMTDDFHSLLPYITIDNARRN